MLRQLLRPVRTVGQRGTRAYHEPTHFKRATMDELPVPQGCWQQAYNAKQKSYNIQLAVGVAYAALTWTYIISTGAIYLHWGPPKELKSEK